MTPIEIIKSLMLEFILFTPLLLLAIGVRKYIGKDASAAEGAI
jgi:hypothetical protein